MGWILYVNVGTETTTQTPTTTATPVPTTQQPSDPLVPIDEILTQALTGSIAYNVPEFMQMNETVTLELLLNPSVSEEQLKQQIEESGSVESGTVQVSPLMKAELFAHDREGLIVSPLHDTPEQPVSPAETTRWQWLVTAKKGGTQGLTLVVYRLVNFDGKDYWREVEAYRANIIVEVSLVQRVMAFDWKWLGGILLTSVLVPAFWRWVDKRKLSRKQKARPSHKSTSN